MITEDYCSFEVSKLLKENGFDNRCDMGWHDRLFDEKHPRLFSINFDSKEHWISCPTQSVAMKWLREVHKISIEIYCIPSYTKGLVVWRYMIRNCETCDEVDYPNGYPAQECLIFEEAVEAALKYSLENLI